MGIEDTQYQVYIENHAKDILYKGTIWECERWISKNGMTDTSYIIDRIKESKKSEPKTKEKKIKKSKKIVSNIVEPLF